MLATVYPNGEIRLRTPRVATTRFGEAEPLQWKVPPSILSIAQKLRLLGATKPVALSDGGEKPGYGGLPRPSRFRVEARRKIVRAGACVGVDDARSRTAFLTGTLPGSTEASFEAIARQSAWVVHQLLTRIPRLWGGIPSECKWIWVWEFQKRGALHWHCVLEVPSQSAFDKVLEGFSGLWNAAIRGVSKRSGVDCAAREGGGTWADREDVWRSSAERLRKRPDRYLAKYLSKGTQEGKEGVFYPTRWYGVSRKLLGVLEASTRRYRFGSSVSSLREVDDVEREAVGYLQESAAVIREFPDKFGRGYTRVFYCEAEVVSEAERIFGRLERTMELADYKEMNVSEDTAYPAIKEVNRIAFLRHRFMTDVGEYYRKLYLCWLDEGEIPEVEKFWLEFYARRLLYITGWRYRGQPPERSGAGLPGRSAPKMEDSRPPVQETVQPYLFDDPRGAGLPPGEGRL